jgi:hypothetical protein
MLKLVHPWMCECVRITRTVGSDAGIATASDLTLLSALRLAHSVVYSPISAPHPHRLYRSPRARTPLSTRLDLSSFVPHFTSLRTRIVRASPADATSARRLEKPADRQILAIVIRERARGCTCHSLHSTRWGVDLAELHQEIIKKIILAFGPYNRLMRPREASRGLTWVI